MFNDEHYPFKITFLIICRNSIKNLTFFFSQLVSQQKEMGEKSICLHLRTAGRTQQHDQAQLHKSQQAHSSRAAEIVSLLLSTAAKSADHQDRCQTSIQRLRAAGTKERHVHTLPLPACRLQQCQRRPRRSLLQQLTRWHLGRHSYFYLFFGDKPITASCNISPETNLPTHGRWHFGSELRCPQPICILADLNVKY